MSETPPLLTVRDLRVSYRTRRSTVDAVRGASLTVPAGETVALVGESGSGKSTVGLAVLGLLPEGAEPVTGSIALGGRELVGLPDRELRGVRGREIGFVPQDPKASLNPVQRVGAQVAEGLRIHRLVDSRAEAARRAEELLADAGLPEPARVAQRFPHELSGGMCQRVLIAIALAGQPRLLVADEPTSALDVTVQRRILDHLAEVTRDAGTGLLLITHDLAVAAERAERIAVMSAGRVVEEGPSARVIGAPAHAYTRELVAAAPSMAAPAAPAAAVRAEGPETLLAVEDLRKVFQVRLPNGGRERVAAVDGVSFTLERGGSLGIVGESGSGKSTTAQLLLRLDRPDSGRVVLDGVDLATVRPARLRRLRRDIQPVFQDAYGSLDPTFTVEEAIAEPLAAFGVGGRAERVAELLDLVRLPSTTRGRRPTELSGGQRQRVCIARALALTPRLLVLDEPVSALDVSVQAGILALLARLREELGLSYVFISHDLAVVRQVCDRVVVMRRGKVVESGPVAEVFAEPRHPYTRELLAAIPGGLRAPAPAVTAGTANAAIPQEKRLT
ncbi:dipeptide ABC transporter ATP-binding protein [Streptomyces radicis]|uniref:ABC transporter ATP-binding protein n=1 Tax=Streptomyces radicis TaxID=1750517 RepID=A0A3A9W5B6_9ACTN|nr:ABC transporter ATP-binding protein [Streptomyces radicis]RKN08348.1 ABC transporter ATP-binding protein [Streptomyces radicis]RKN21616.1 ABC transporter ATP-binding protein [Streptomyces radicis]